MRSTLNFIAYSFRSIPPPQELKATPSCRWHLPLRRGDRIVALLLRRVKSLLALSGLSFSAQSGDRQDRNLALQRPHSPGLSVFALPRISHGAGAGVGGG